MNVKDLKIGTQLTIGFGMILFFFVLLSGDAWFLTNEIAQQNSNLYEHPMQVQRAIGKLRGDILEMQLELRDYLMADNEQNRETALISSEIFQNDAERQFQILYERYLGPVSDIDSAHAIFLQWVKKRAKSFQLGQTGKMSEALRDFETSGDIGNDREQLFLIINKIDNFSSAKGNELFAKANKLNNSLDWQLGAMVAAIFALSFLILYTLIYNIRRPLIELTKATRRFREGKMDARSTYSSQNEFGALSVSFNDLADTIETEMSLNLKTSKLDAVMLSEENDHRFCHALLSALLEHTEAQMGAVYLLNDEKTKFELFNCIGISADVCKPFSAVNFEGEFGLALSTNKVQYISNIPKDTQFTFNIVGGTFAPREMITVPIVTGNGTVAIISLATVSSFNKNSMRLLNMTLSTLSARMDGILSYKKIIVVSKQLEIQNSELESQKNELYAQTSELTEQNIELEMQKKQLDEANKMKTSFLSSMSHELRTPLNSVIALSGVLDHRLNGKIGEEELSFLDVIGRNGKHLLSLINDILDLSRIEAGREEIEIDQFNISELISEVVDLIRPLAIQKNIGLRCPTVDTPPMIRSDYEKCRHTLQNLVANAVKFTEVGSVVITVNVVDSEVNIVVTDTGIGIGRDHLPFIFEEFRQADGSNSRKYGGTGLGLAIAKKYAEMLGGHITVESVPQQGSCFTLVLPINSPLLDTGPGFVGQLPNKPLAKPGKQSEEIDKSNKTILLVEDTEAIIVQMKDILELQGYNIMVALNGQEALVQIAKKIPDAMILDLMMPGVDGFEVLRSIRGDAKTERIPVIILTAKYVTKEELSFLKHNGIHQLIRKGDINKDQLMNEIDNMMRDGGHELETRLKRMAVRAQSDTPKVLVVEDNPDNMLTIKALLGNGCSVIEAVDGKQGLELAISHQPHLILMDIALPKMNGIEVLQEIRKDEKLGHIPVIAVSASAMKGDHENFISHGFDGYIPKPIDSTLFYKMIKEFLN